MSEGPRGPRGPQADDGRLIVVFMGAAGAGKGTQAAMLSREMDLMHLASGDLFRAARDAGTPLGETARAYMDRGELVPDDVTIAMVMEALATPPASLGAILDGFPRTVAQARALDDNLAKAGERVNLVVHIDVPTEELIRRVAGRWICPLCGTPYHLDTDPPVEAGICDRDGSPLQQRDDDRPEVVRARLEKQVPPMRSVLEHYDRAGVLEHVDGTQPIETVSDAIRDAIEAVARGAR